MILINNFDCFIIKYAKLVWCYYIHFKIVIGLMRFIILIKYSKSIFYVEF